MDQAIGGEENLGLQLGSSQLYWHNFRIIGTVFGSISIENYASIIGSSLGMASYPIGPQHVEMPY